MMKSTKILKKYADCQGFHQVYWGFMQYSEIQIKETEFSNQDVQCKWM